MRRVRIAARALLTLIATFVLCFILLQALPGSPFERLDSPSFSASDAARTRTALGLDRPVGEQLFVTARSYLRGDFGTSFTRQRPVRRALAEALPATLILGGSALIGAYLMGLIGAVILHLLPRRSSLWGDRAALVVSIVPGFWLALLLVLVFSYWAGWLPSSHATSAFGGGLSDRLQHLVLPWATLAIPAACTIARYQAAALRREEHAAHVRRARAAGLSGPRLFWSHLLRPNLMPTIALFGLDLPILVSGAFVIEVVFAWPGIGRLTVNAILESDYPLALAATLLGAVLVVAGRTLTEWISARNDPRLGRETA